MAEKIVKTFASGTGIGSDMPLTDNSRMVSVRLEHFGDRNLVLVQSLPVARRSIMITVAARQQRTARRCT